MNHLSAVGLVFDIAGVVLLAWAIMRVPAMQIREQAATFWGANLNFVRAVIEQQTDAFAGLPCLVLGFMLQLIGTVGWLAPKSAFWWFGTVLLAVAIAFYLLWLRARLIKRRFAVISKLVAQGEITQEQMILENQQFNR